MGLGVVPNIKNNVHCSIFDSIGNADKIKGSFLLMATVAE